MLRRNANETSWEQPNQQLRIKMSKYATPLSIKRFHNRKTDVVQLRNATLHTNMHNLQVKTKHAINNKWKTCLSIAFIFGSTIHKHKACIHTISEKYKHEYTNVPTPNPMNKNKYDKHTYRHTKTKKTCYQNTILTPMVKDPGGGPRRPPGQGPRKLVASETSVVMSFYDNHTWYPKCVP